MVYFCSRYIFKDYINWISGIVCFSNNSFIIFFVDICFIIWYNNGYMVICESYM